MIRKVLFLLALTLYPVQPGPVIDTQYGKIEGLEEVTMTGKKYYSFNNIPYASPPINDLRFKAPAPLTPWEGIWNGTGNDEWTVKCLQVGFSRIWDQEDCLYLHIHTPRLPSDPGNGSAVIIFVDSPLFEFGPNPYKPQFMIDLDVLVVNAYFRLGPLGFFSTGDEYLPGNYGLKDLHFAVKWVHENIQSFGGDPNRITISGHEHSAAAMSYLLLHPQSEGLFAGVILQSGTFLMPQAFARNSTELTFLIASYLNKTFETNRNSKDLVDFLMTVDAVRLYEVAGSYNGYFYDIFEGMNFGPVVEPEHEGAIVSKNMYQQLKSGDVIKVPILMGINSEEALGGPYNNVYEYLSEQYDKHPFWMVPGGMRIKDEDEKNEMGLKIRDIYTHGEPIYHKEAAITRLFSDNLYTRSVIKHAELQSQFSDVYFYQFSYDGELGEYGSTTEGAERVRNGEELNYIWMTGGNRNISLFPETDQLMAKRVQKLWSDFIKFQNPTPEASELLQNITWPKMSPDKFVYLNINETLEIREQPKADTYSKYVELYNSLGYDDFDTY